MSRSWARPVAWVVAVGCVGLTCAALLLQFAFGATLEEMAESFFFTNAAVALSWPLVGAIVATHLPRHRIAWIFLGLGPLQAVTGAGTAFYIYSYSVRELPVAATVGWLASWLWILSFPLVALAVLIFPAGQFLSPRWRWVHWWTTVITVALTLGWAVWAWPPKLSQQKFEAQPESFLFDLAWMAIMLGLVTAVASIVVRFRRATGIERQQLKLVTYAAGIAISITVATTLLPDYPWQAQVASDASLTLVPIAVGIAVLRYHLYDIDRLINRTLVYGVVTLVLALGYAGGVLLAQAVLPVTDDSPAVVAITTLAVVALFRPLRNRVQGFVDRRFYRRRYDAARTIESFGSRLRQETDLDSLRDELLGLVKDTMQPAHASLWLRSGLER